MEVQEVSVYTPEEKRASLGVAYATVARLCHLLEMAKPGNRSKQDRAIAIALIDAQKLLAWIKTYCME